VLTYSLPRKESIFNIAKNSFDYQTVLFLIGLFIIVGAVEKVGIINDLANIFASIGNQNVFLLYTVIVFASVVLSAFIDNIPYVATMLPIITGLGINPTLMYFGLLSGATLGGNITPIGASANITGTAILRREGYEVKNKDFFKIGIPFTLGAIIPAYAYIWLLFGV
jgi:Na+/H+ antiporter NhaD/arsenite permease-like protein